MKSTDLYLSPLSCHDNIQSYLSLLINILICNDDLAVHFVKHPQVAESVSVKEKWVLKMDEGDVLSQVSTKTDMKCVYPQQTNMKWDRNKMVLFRKYICILIVILNVS